MDGKGVRIWLWIGVAMLFFQIVLGGITRLTGSGLSITRWDIVTGTLPPLNEGQWQEEFLLYQETPQYQKINEGMTLREFKFIYFWEYIHRLWARSIGFVFLFPFLYFALTRKISKKLYFDLGIAVLLGVLVATFGWIMVASGLINRPWVSAYKLTLHLNLGLLVYAWMFWVASGKVVEIRSNALRKWLIWMLMIVVVQLLLGGLMSGMKAALYYPTWPDMHGDFFPKSLINSNLWSTDSFIHYEKGLVPGLVQFAHRSIGYILFVMIAFFVLQIYRHRELTSVRKMGFSLFIIVSAQVILGILTLINSVGSIPFWYGIFHQIGAIALLSCLLFFLKKIRK